MIAWPVLLAVLLVVAVLFTIGAARLRGKSREAGGQPAASASTSAGDLPH